MAWAPPHRKKRMKAVETTTTKKWKQKLRNVGNKVCDVVTATWPWTAIVIQPPLISMAATRQTSNKGYVTFCMNKKLLFFFYRKLCQVIHCIP